MRLYKMELYKICSKKLFLFSAFASLVIMVLYLWNFVIGTDSTVNGVRYEGLQAVRMDREITEEFRGVLTDQKVTQIIEKYGFPNGVSEHHNAFLNKNYLNDFVMYGFSDGYYYGWDDYQVGTCTYPIAETKLGIASTVVGKTLMLEYSYGWQVFTNVLNLGCILGMVIILLAVSAVFSEESSMNTQQILFTTKEGKAKDIIAKIAAAMTVAIGVYAVIVILDFVLVWAIFGLDGLDCLYSMVMQENYVPDYNHFNNMSTWYMKDFVKLAVFSSFLGMVEAAAMSLYLSAHCNSPFHAIIASFLCLLTPICLNMTGRSNFNGILFIMSQLFNVLLLGVALMCFAQEIPNKAGSFAKAMCCILPMSAGLCFRRIFPFYYTIPVSLIITEMLGDLDIMAYRFPWIREEAFLFASIASVVFIVCSWKKYRG